MSPVQPVVAVATLDLQQHHRRGWISVVYRKTATKKQIRAWCETHCRGRWIIGIHWGHENWGADTVRFQLEEDAVIFALAWR